MAWLLAAAATVGGTGPGATKEKSPRGVVTIAVNASTSLESAQARARAAVAAGETAVTILVGQGVTKALTKPIVLGPEDSGVAWRGAEGAVISGGVSLPLSAFAPIPAAVGQAGAPAPAVEPRDRRRRGREVWRAGGRRARVGWESQLLGRDCNG